MQNVGLIIGLPTRRNTYPVSIQWAMAFKALNPPINYNVTFAQVVGHEVADARNMIVQEALNKNAKYIFFLGDDVIVPAHALKQLIFRMEHDENLGVVGGIYCSKSNPPAPLVFRGNGQGSYWNWKLGEYFEVSGLGMDCTLIRTEIFKHIPQPWFYTSDTNQFVDGINNAEQWTEDLWFCEQVGKTKYKIYADAMVICEHWDAREDKFYSLPKNSYPLQPITVKEGNKKIVDIGCGETVRTFEEGTPIRVDIREECAPDYRCDVRTLPFDNKSFDIVFSSHVLEHFGRHEVRDVLKEWIRILKDDGELRLILPNIEWACRDILNNNCINLTDSLNVLYGAQSNPYDFHKNGFNRYLLEFALREFKMEITSYSEQGYNMIISARFI